MMNEKLKNELYDYLNELYDFNKCDDDDDECYYDDDMFNSLFEQIEIEIKKHNINFVTFEIDSLNCDDYYCIFLYDENKKLLRTITFDFDFNVVDDENEYLSTMQCVYFDDKYIRDENCNSCALLKYMNERNI